MRYLILSDIHSNQEALESCIQRAKQAGYDAVLCCGDIVGYGPSPVETIDVLRSLNPVCIRGNHDRVAAGLDEFTAVKCEAGKRMLVNPGSIGQPRDGDFRASFVIWDQSRSRIEFYRA